MENPFMNYHINNLIHVHIQIKLSFDSLEKGSTNTGKCDDVYYTLSNPTRCKNGCESPQIE